MGLEKGKRDFKGLLEKLYIAAFLPGPDCIFQRCRHQHLLTYMFFNVTLTLLHLEIGPNLPPLETQADVRTNL